MGRTMRQAVVIALAGVAWAVTVLDAMAVMPAWYSPGVDRLMVGVAGVTTVRLFLWCHQRPLGEVYQVAYDAGRRDQMREANRRDLSPIRPASRGLTEFNTAHRKRLAAKVDA